MTDIVELLERGVDTNAIPDVTDRVMERGAAEIRRLRTEKDILALVTVEQQGEIKRLRAEVKRYEDARINPDENDCCTAYQAEVEQLRSDQLRRVDQQEDCRFEWQQEQARLEAEIERLRTFKHKPEVGGSPCPTCGFVITYKKAEPLMYEDEP
jgi:hypothetical protein